MMYVTGWQPAADKIYNKADKLFHKDERRKFINSKKYITNTMRLQTVWLEGSDCSEAQKGINGGKLAKRSVILTFPKLPLPSTMRKLKSEARITSFLPMLCGTSLSDTSGGFFVIDVFYNHKGAQCYHSPQALKHDYIEGKNIWSLPVNRYKNIKQCVFKSEKKYC